MGRVRVSSKHQINKNRATATQFLPNPVIPLDLIYIQFYVFFLFIFQNPRPIFRACGIVVGVMARVVKKHCCSPGEMKERWAVSPN